MFRTSYASRRVREKSSDHGESRSNNIDNLPVYNGAYHYIIPFASPLIVVGGQGYSVDQNAPGQSVNSSGKFEFSFGLAA